MRILVFQHIACEHPGIFRRFFAEDRIDWRAVELDEGEPIPPLEDYDALWVMGGAMDVWDVEECPWLIDEKRAIRRFVRELNRPYFGFCLGHQLLADALGGTCGPQRPSEIGILDYRLTPEGMGDPIFAGIEPEGRCLQWHSVRVAQPPEGAKVLASSKLCPVQAMKVADRAYGFQYHVELEADTIPNWGCVPAYAAALEASKGEGALEGMIADAQPLMADFERSSRTLYRNFMRMVRC